MSRLIICRTGVWSLQDTARAGRKPARTLARTALLGAMVALGACSSAPPEIPRPRPIVIHSGARIRSDHEEMKVVNEWVTREQTNITDDPSFMIVANGVVPETFPWEGITYGTGGSQDSVSVNLPLGGRDARLVYELYGHMQLMARTGRQEEWLPEAPDAVGYDLERAIVARIADAWILGRTVFDTQPFAPLDELAYSKDAGFLDAFIFTARPGEFAASRAQWARENPGESERYRDWFLDTFNQEPPGIRTNE